MANCYICGASEACYRREVYTGRSSGWGFGKRITSSVRSYYGVRSVCAECAKGIDSRNKIGCVVFLIIGVVVYFGYCSKDSSTSTVTRTPSYFTQPTSQSFVTETQGRIISKKGLRLRTEANIESSVVTTIPFNQKVIVLSKSLEEESVKGTTGYWYEVRFRHHKGWAFSEFIKIGD